MKIYRVDIAVPSGSRLPRFFMWLTNLLQEHRMEVRRVEEPDSGEYFDNSDMDKD